MGIDIIINLLLIYNINFDIYIDVNFLFNSIMLKWMFVKRFVKIWVDKLLSYVWILYFFIIRGVREFFFCVVGVKE